MMKEYGGYPSGWLEEDWATCVRLLDVNAIIQKVQERERKKKKWRNKLFGSGGKAKKPRKRGRKK